MGEPQIAMPLFADTTPRRAAVLASWRSLFPSGPRLAAGKGDDGVDEYLLDDRTVFVANIAMPVPKDEALHAVKSSWMWQGSDEPVRSHRAHAIVTAADHDRAIGGAWDVARLCAALLAAGAGVALYWGSGRQVHMAKIAIRFGSTMTNPPVPLWVGITVSAPSKAGPFSAATHGLEALGFKEFEVRNTTMGLGDLRITLFDMAGYVINAGPVLEHGQTFGPDANARWKITHEPSRLVEGRDAIVLAIP